MIELNVSDGGIVDTFSENRNISRSIIDAVNIWIENCMIHQVIDPGHVAPADYPQNNDLLLDMYFYGLASHSLSLLSLSAKNPAAEFTGLTIEPDKNFIAEVYKEHPIIYFNPLMTGNQNILEPAPSYEDVPSSSFGIAFKDVYGIGFQEFLFSLVYYQKYVLDSAGHDMIATSVECFLETVSAASKPKINAEPVIRSLALTKDVLRKQLRPGENTLWHMGINSYRYELCPFLLLENGWLVISHQALEQAKQLWCSIFSNGGMPYTNKKDSLTEAIDAKNTELSKKLVALIREKLRNHYKASLDEIEASYDRIFGRRPVDYGDFDLVFYAKDVGELFLIEAKFFSDSLTGSGIVRDFTKMFGEGGYYEHCRARFDLVLAEPEKMKAFVSADAPVEVHFLFVSSKPLEVEFQDKDKITTFLSLNVFDKYLEGKLEDSEDGSIKRPTFSI